MSAPTPSAPPPQPTAVDHFGAFARGVLLFLVGDIVVVSAFSANGSWLAGLIFLLVVAGVVWRLARTKWRWIGIGLAASFGLMTLLTGGVCTLFGGNSDAASGGMFFLIIAILLLLIAAVLERRQAFTRRRSPPPPRP